ncbi:alpha/beta hydrolase [Streptomyces sp. DH37]|uniref:alpha/beta hydrolase n=1 Tax=Streptomyces sp. DH37 TaxID=3040122 RepID=UPI0024424E07|nr:alpha/beta hydrolase [Streptomyces sp. DH37]MDG9702777.1 alpha/beta hydrolase [Streptomyces sp. DH37]
MGFRPRRRRRRLRRALLSALVVASVAVPVAGAARPSQVPAPEPAALGPLVASPEALAARYAANRAGIRAAGRAAGRHGDAGRAAALRAMAEPDRRFLLFDGRDGGRSAEVFGDLSRAGRIAVLVPGSDTGLDRYERLRTGARTLLRELDGRSAVVAWLGYETPGTVSPAVLTTGRAEEAAPGLRRFTGELAHARPGARISLLCHSYGAVVCGLAASGLEADALVLYGGPGAGADSAAGLRTRAVVWAGRGGGDWIARVPNVRLELPGATLGLGADPVSREFGARVFDAGGGGHSDYLVPGSRSLANIARIVAGRPPAGEARHA